MTSGSNMRVEDIVRFSEVYRLTFCKLLLLPLFLNGWFLDICSRMKKDYERSLIDERQRPYFYRLCVGQANRGLFARDICL